MQKKRRREVHDERARELQYGNSLKRWRRWRGESGSGKRLKGKDLASDDP